MVNHASCPWTVRDKGRCIFVLDINFEIFKYLLAGGHALSPGDGWCSRADRGQALEPTASDPSARLLTNSGIRALTRISSPPWLRRPGISTCHALHIYPCRNQGSSRPIRGKWTAHYLEQNRTSGRTHGSATARAIVGSKVPLSVSSLKIGHLTCFFDAGIFSRMAASRWRRWAARRSA